jgi:hypothetical protein
MANFRITIEKADCEKSSTIRFIFTNDVDKDAIINSLKKYFEIEMYSAKILTNDENTEITIKTESLEKVEILRSNMLRTFRESTGLGNINQN